MYCKNCHTLMPDGEVICEVCGYDNSNESDELEETREIQLDAKKEKTKEDIKKIKKGLIILFILLIVGGVSFYIINDSKSIDESKQDYNETSAEEFDKKFTLNNLVLSYPSSLFGASKSTIFYKNNNAYNIEIQEISEDTYNKMRNEEFKDQATIGNIITYTHAGDKNYEHILENTNKFYSIVVNYIVDETLESTKTQMEMTRIINSIHFE